MLPCFLGRAESCYGAKQWRQCAFCALAHRSDLGMGRFDRASDDEGADEEGGGVDGASGSARGDGAESDPGTALALGADRALSLRGQGPGAVAKTAAEFFHAKRSYWGLETPVRDSAAPGHPTGARKCCRHMTARVVVHAVDGRPG